MKLSLLGPACDHAVRRGWLIEQIAAVERGEYTFCVAGKALTGAGIAMIKDTMLRALKTDLAVCEQNLIALGVEISDAGKAADIPACRVEAAGAVVTTSRLAG